MSGYQGFAVDVGNTPPNAGDVPMYDPGAEPGHGRWVPVPGSSFGPSSAIVPLENLLYVAQSNNSGFSSNGSIEAPFTTIEEAVEFAEDVGYTTYTIGIAAGDYRPEGPVIISHGSVAIVGLGGALSAPKLPSFIFSSIETSFQGYFENCVIDTSGETVSGVPQCTLTFQNCQNVHVIGTSFNVKVNGGSVKDGIASTAMSFRNSVTFSAGAVLAANNITWDRGSEKAAGASAAVLTIVQAPISLAGSDPMYGYGGDGVLAIAAGTTDPNNLITQSAEYTNVTISGTGSFQTRGKVPLVVSGILDLSNAPLGAIQATIGSGTNAALAVAGTTQSSQGGQMDGGAGTTLSQNGAAGVPGIGVLPAALLTLRSGGGNGGASGASGNGVAVGIAGGVGGIFSTPQKPLFSRVRMFSGPSVINGVNAVDSFFGGAAGRGGASGGGNNAAVPGGGGGGGGNGGGTIIIFARCIKLGAATAPAAIRAPGGTGGNGGNGTADALATGGGSGAGAGGGGSIIIYYEWLLGTNPGGNVIQAPGGTGGNGGNGNGSGAATGGAGGTGGSGGMVLLINTLTGLRTYVAGAAGTAGNAAVGNAGGAGGAGGACNANFV